MRKIFLLAFLALFMIRAIAQPSSAAAPPTANAGGVMSVLGSHYTAVSNAAGTGVWTPNWGQATGVSFSNIGGSDTTIKYNNFNYQGVQFNGALNVSSMDSIHVDIWSSTCSVVQLHLIWGAESGPNITLNSGSWTSVTLALNSTNFPGANFANIIQFKFTAITPGSGSSIYLENVYFCQNANKPIITGFTVTSPMNTGDHYTITDPTSTNTGGGFTYSSSNTAVATVSGNTITAVNGGTTTITCTQAASGSFVAGSKSASLTVNFAVPSGAAATPTRDPGNVLSVFGSHYTQNSYASGTGVWHQSWGQATNITYSKLGSDTTMKYDNFNYQGVQFSTALNVSAYDSLHLDIWSPNVAKIDIDFIGGSEHDYKYTLPLSLAAGWNSMDIPLTNYTATSPIVNLASLLQFKFDITTNSSPNITSGGVVYFENIYFYKKAGGPTIGSFTIPAQTYTGSTSTYTITNPSSNSGGAFTYSSGNTSVATVSGNTISILGAGTAIITATQAANGIYLAGTASTTLTVNYASPATAAAAPTIASPYVFSLYGDTYTNLAGIDWHPNWGQPTTITNTTIGGASTIEYANLSYEGVNLPADENVSTMDSLRFNVWSPNCTSLKVALINTTGGTVQQFVTVSLTTNTWNAISIPLSSFSPVNMSKIAQMSFTTVTPGSGAIIYLQNIYFMNVVGKPTITGFSIPTQTYTGSNFTYTITDPSSNSTGAFTYTSSNTSVATVSGNVITVKAIGTSTITATEAADDNYLSGTAVATLTVDYPSPSTAAPAPTKSSSNVISLFGDTYTNVTGTNWGPIWGGPTQGVYTAVTVAGTSTNKYSQMGYSGVQFASTIDASLMDTLHLDVWTPNCTSFNLFIINTSNGANQHVTITPTTSGWNSIDIPMSSYSVEANHVDQFKIESNTPTSGAVLYIQNIYFYKIAGKPTISGFTLPGSLTSTSAPFTITDPTSNSNGSFSYTSANTSVATISGHTVTIHGAGTSVITATQAADPTDGYVSGSITAVLSVNYPVPSTAAAVPTAPSGEVISLFGDTYTNVSGTNWNPGWGSATYTGLTVGGKSTIEYSGLGFGAVQFSTGVNASTMKILHLDVWTPNCTAFEIYLISTDNGGQNQVVTVHPTTYGWNSINIATSNFSSVVIGDVNQMKINAVTPSSAAVLYFQNVYFVKTTPTWTGASSTNYSTAANWDYYGLVPGSADSVVIPSGPTNQPVLSANTTIAGLNLGGSLSLNGKTLTLNRFVSGSGSFKGSATSSISTSATGTIYFNSSKDTLQNLTITGGAVTLGNALNLTGVLTPTAGTLNTGNYLTLKSTSDANTAIVGFVGGTVSGNVTVERFIPIGLRSFRDLGPSVYGAGSIFNNWQEGGAYPTNYGMYITGKVGAFVPPNSIYDATTGFDLTSTGTPTIYSYTAGNWASLSATAGTKGTNLDPFQGLRTLIRGARNYNLNQQFPSMRSATTLRATGALVTGDVTFTTSGTSSASGATSSYGLTNGADAYSFIANPYACPIDWYTIYNNNAGNNISSSYLYLDPTFLASGYNVYITYNAVSNSTNNPAGSIGSREFIQPGQGFFVQNNGATTSPVYSSSITTKLVIHEGDKAVNHLGTNVFGVAKPNVLAIGLSKNINGTDLNVDGAVAVFRNDFTKNIGAEDSKKIANSAENISIAEANNDLSIDGLPTPAEGDVVALKLDQVIAGTTYQLSVDVSNYAGLDVYIHDALTKTEVPVTTAVSFTPTTDASTFANRFSIVFKASKTIPVVISGKLSVYPNPVTDKVVTVQTLNIATGKYNVTLTNNMGQTVFSSTINHLSGSSIETIKMNKSMTSGVYTMLLKNTDGTGLYQSELLVK